MRGWLFRRRILLAWGVALLAAAAIPPASAATARLTLRPNTGPPTSSTTVSGSGFASGEAVTVTFDGTTLASPTTSGGKFSVSVQVPATSPPGAHTIMAQGASSGTTAQATFTVRTDWIQFHFNGVRSGFNPFENVLDPGKAAGITERRRTPVGTSVLASPVYCAGRIFVGSTDGSLRGVNADGTVAWTYSVGSAPTTAAAVPSGACTVMVGGADGSLAAVDGGTGAQVWRTTVGGAVLAPPLYAPGGKASSFKVVVGTQAAQVRAYNETGGQLFNTPVGGPISQGPVLVGIPHQGAQFIVATDTGVVYALDATTGKVLRSVVLDGAVTAGPAAGDLGGGAAVFVGTSAGTVYSLSQTDLGIRWTFGAGSQIVGTPSIGDPGPVGSRTGIARLFAESADGTVRAFDEVSGNPALAWATALGAAPAGATALADGVLYATGTDGVLRAYDATSGLVLFTSTSMSASGSAIVADGQVITGTTTGDVVVLGG